jgi:catechol 2,3-dioxygenase-like lactoylglutathione lyase family enzyme
MAIDINGVAHLYITVQDFERCRPFYGALLPFFGMVCLVDTAELYYCIGGRTGIGIRAASNEHHHTPFDQYRAGLHHLCLRARSAADVDAVANFVADLAPRHGGALVHRPQLDEWAPGYYSVLFEDPCGTRLEVNYVPGKGHLAQAAETPLTDGVQQRLSDA